MFSASTFSFFIKYFINILMILIISFMFDAPGDLVIDSLPCNPQVWGPFSI